MDDMYETRAYREYVTESLRLQGEGKILASRWIDAVSKKAEDSRSADEIAIDVITKAGLTMKGGEEDGRIQFGSEADT